MTRAEARLLARRWARQHGIPAPRLTWSLRSVDRAAVAHIYSCKKTGRVLRGEIEFCPDEWVESGRQARRNLLVHEMAHILCDSLTPGGADHGRYWRAWCRRLSRSKVRWSRWA